MSIHPGNVVEARWPVHGTCRDEDTAHVRFQPAKPTETLEPVLLPKTIRCICLLKQTQAADKPHQGAPRYITPSVSESGGCTFHWHMFTSFDAAWNAIAQTGPSTPCDKTHTTGN